MILSEQEKNRIRKLHKNYSVIKEQNDEGKAGMQIINDCVDEEISLIDDRKLIRQLPKECRKWMGYEVTKQVLGKKAAVAAFPNYKENQQLCILNGLIKITEDDETFDRVMDQIDDIVDCMVAKGMDVDLDTLKDL